MILRNGRRIFVERWLAISGSVLWKMRKVEISRLFDLILLVYIGWIHDRRFSRGRTRHYLASKEGFEGDKGIFMYSVSNS
jgi:hypothetical protein